MILNVKGNCNRGTVIGILKAMLGLSASIYTAIYVAFLDPDSVTFLLLLAILPSLLALLCVPFINKVPFIQTELHTKVERHRPVHCALPCRLL